MDTATDITRAEEHLAPAIATTETSAIISLIERAARDPSVDIEKMERLFNMHNDMIARQAKVAYNGAFAQMQPELPEIDENGSIRHKENGPAIATYALWEDINDAIKPILHKHGFGISFRPGKKDGLIVTTCILSHKDGHSEEATVELGIDASGAKNAVQGVGSSLSYGKRYAATMLLNITTRKDPNDDNGQSATKEKAGVSSAQAKKDGLWEQAEIDLGAQQTKRGLDKAMTHHQTVLGQVRNGNWLPLLAELYDKELARIKTAEFGLDDR